MSSDLLRYIAEGGTVTVCGYVARVISLKMRLSFNRYVVDKAVEQKQPIDPVEIINAANPKGPSRWLTRGAHLRNPLGSSILGKPSALPPPVEGPPGLRSR
jgi:hypothetical protein